MASTVRVRILGDASDLKKATRQAEDAVGSLQDSFAGVAAKLGGAFAAIGAGNLVKGAIDAAADIGEQYSKLSVLVGDSAKELDDWSKTTAKSIGVGRQEALKGLGTFANLFQAMGKGQGEVAAMSKRFVELATDMASFNNANPAEVIEALGAALRGESEPIRAFGVMLDDATLKQQALKLGLISTTKEALSPAIKMQAAYYEILAQTGKQQGDVARTSESLSNQTRFLAAEFKDLQIELGQQLLPIAAEVVSALRNGLIPSMQAVLPVIGGVAETAFDAGRALASVVSPFADGAAQAVVFAAGSAAAYQALLKLAEGGKKAQLVMGGLATTLTTPMGVAGLGATLIGGALAYAFVEHQKEAAASKARQEQLTAALREANDPARLLADRYKALAEELDKLKPKQDDATEAVEGVGEQFLFSKLQARDAATDFNRLGLSLEEVTKATQLAEPEWQNYIRALQKSAGEQGVFGKRAVELVGALTETREAWKLDRQEQAEWTKDGLEGLVVAKRLTQAELDRALATSTATDETGKWLEVGEQYADLLGEVEAKTGEATAATEEATDAAVAQTGAVTDLKSAQEKLVEQIDKVIEATLASLNADLALTRQQRQMAESSQELQQKQADLTAAVRDHGAGSQEAAVAQYEYEKALDSAKQEALNTAGAAVELAKRQAEVQGVTLSAQEASGLMARKLVELRDASGDPQLRAYLDAVIGQMWQAESAARAAQQQIAEVARQMALAAGAQEMPGVGIITSADRLAGRASGGPVKAGTSYLVGEQGPEVLTMGRQSGYVTPNSALAGAAGGIVVQSLTLNGVMATSMDEVARQIREAIRRIERGQR